MPKRLFVALMTPQFALDELAAATLPLPGDLSSEVRWSRIESWHLTLAFLGSVEPPTAHELREQLAQVAQLHRPIQLQIAGAGHFNNRVLWAGIGGDRAALGRLAESVRAAVGRSGIEVETKPYRGHITLARASGSVKLQPFADRLREFSGASWTATELNLVESRLGAGPGRTALHEIHAQWPLGQRCETGA